MYKWASNSPALFVRIRADNSKVKRDLKETQRAVTTRMQRIGQVARDALSGIGIASLGAGLFAAAREASEFEQAMINVRANARLLGEAGREAFQSLTRTAREMGATTKFSAVQAANALNQLALAGLNAKQATGALPSVLNLAASANIGLANSANIIANNMVKYGLAAEDTGRIADFLSSAQSRAQITATQLAQAFQSLGSIAPAMGANLKETTAILVGMGKAGTEMTKAGTALAIALQRLAQRPKPVADALKSMNVEVERFQKPGGGVDLIPLFKEIATKLPENAIERGSKAMAIFGARGRAILGVLNLLRKGRFVEDTAKGLEDDIGRAATVAEEKMDTFQGTLLELRSALGELAISGFLPVLKGLEPVIDAFKSAAAGVAAFNEATGQLLSRIVKLGGTVAGAIGSFFALRLGASLVAKGFKLIFTRIGLIVTAVTGLVAGFKKLMENLRGTSEGQEAISRASNRLSETWRNLKRTGEIIFRRLKELVEETFGASFQSAADMANFAIISVLDSVSSFVLKASNEILLFVKTWNLQWERMKISAALQLVRVADKALMMWNTISAATIAGGKAWFTLMMNTAKAIGQIFVDIGTAAFEAIKNAFGFIMAIGKDFATAWIDIFKVVDGAIRDLLFGRDVGEGIKRRIKDIASETIKQFDDAKNDISSTVDDIGKTVKEDFDNLGSEAGKVFIDEFTKNMGKDSPLKDTINTLENDLKNITDKISKERDKMRKGKEAEQFTKDFAEGIVDDAVRNAQGPIGVLAPEGGNQEQKAQKAGEKFGQAAARPLLEAGRFSFRDIGKSLQDKLIDPGKDLDSERNKELKGIKDGVNKVAKNTKNQGTQPGTLT